MMILALYLAYLGYDVIFFAAQESQIRKPQEYMADFIDRSFLQLCVKEQAKRSVSFEAGGSIQLLNLTEKQARSPRADVLIYDEEAQADLDAYRASAGIMKSSELGLKIHCSTPVKGTIFEDNHNRLLRKEEDSAVPLVLKKAWYDIGFLSRNANQYEADRLSQPDWFFRQENECTFENPQGAIFKSVLFDSTAIEDYIKQHNVAFDPNMVAGLDWNPVAGHYIVCGKWSTDHTCFYVSNVMCLKMGYSHQMDRNNYLQIAPYMSDRNKLCVEAGGVNEPFCDWLKKEMNDGSITPKHVVWEEWDSVGKNKYNCVMNLLSKMLLIDRNKFPILAKEVSEAHWDEDKTDPTLFKSAAASPHALDALLHATSPELTRIYRIRGRDW